MRQVVLPASKSLSNRVLLIGLYADLEIFNLLKSDDTAVMLSALETLGLSVKTLQGTERSMAVAITGAESARNNSEDVDLYVENAGTATRFLTAALPFWSKSVGRKFRLHGTDRMHERPINDLVEALRQLGAEITYDGKEGFLPLTITAAQQTDQMQQCLIKQDISSQYLSGLLLNAPFWFGETVIKREGEVVSQSYIELTLRMMADLGLLVDFDQTANQFVIAGKQQIKVDQYTVESDLSAASYWVARSALTGERISLVNVSLDSAQGDRLFIEQMREAGLELKQNDAVLELFGAKKLNFPGNIDCRDFPDAAMTLAIVIAISGQTVELTGLANLRVKECDRLQALATELAKVGVRVTEQPGGLVIAGINATMLQPAQIETYRDHRMAMCFGVLQLLEPGIEILDPGCVSKTYPTFWDDFA